jgi:hypothetical protein
MRNKAYPRESYEWTHDQAVIGIYKPRTFVRASTIDRLYLIEFGFLLFFEELGVNTETWVKKILQTLLE